MQLKILVVEDDPRWHAIIAGILEESADFEVAGQAFGVEDAKRIIDAQKFHYALIDLGLPDGSGFDVLDHLLQRQPRVRAAVCTVFEDAGSVLKAIRAGAAGYILKDRTGYGLLDMLRHLRDGGAPISPRVARHILDQIKAPTHGDQEDLDETIDFTARELEVLQQVARGMTSREVGKVLGVAESTVRTHVKNIYSKLGVSRRSAAVLEASRRGFL